MFASASLVRLFMHSTQSSSSWLDSHSLSDFNAEVLSWSCPSIFHPPAEWEGVCEYTVRGSTICKGRQSNTLATQNVSRAAHGGALTHTHDHLVWEVELDVRQLKRLSSKHLLRLLDHMEGDRQTDTNPWKAGHMSHRRILLSSACQGAFGEPMLTKARTALCSAVLALMGTETMSR